jgi:hypothetical protein
MPADNCSTLSEAGAMSIEVGAMVVDGDGAVRRPVDDGGPGREQKRRC